MATGYTRQRAANIVTGGVITADDFNAEYNQIESAFNASSGHNHDGTAGGGAGISKVGPSADYEFDSNAMFPKTGSTSLDIGKTGQKFDNGFFGGTIDCNAITVATDAQINDELTVDGAVVMNGAVTMGNATADTIIVNGLINSDLKPQANTKNLGTASLGWNNLYIEGTADIATVDIEAGAIDNTTIGAATASTGAFTTLSASGAATLASTLGVTGASTLGSTLAVTGATGIDGDFDINTDKFTVASASGNTVVAGTLNVTGASTLTGAVTASGGVTGNVTGNITGNVTGDVVGDVTGDVTGDLTGNVTGTGTSALGTVNVSTALNSNGNTVLGNALSDTVTVGGTVNSHLRPNADSTYTLGDSARYWSHGYIDAITTTGDVTVGGTLGVTGTITGDINGNAATATQLQTSRNIAGQAFNGSADISIAPTDLTGVTASAAEINKLDGVTASTAELNNLVGVTSSPAEINKLDGLTASTTELNLLDSVTAGSITANKAVAYNGSGEIAANAIDLQDNWKIEATSGYLKILQGTTVVMRLATNGAVEFRNNVTAYDTSIT